MVSVVDQKLLFSDPDPTFQEISDPDSDAESIIPDPANNSNRIRILNTGYGRYLKTEVD